MESWRAKPHKHPAAEMPDDLRVCQRLLLQARPYWPHIGIILVLSLAATPLALLTPLPLKIAVDSALSDHPLPGALIPFIPDSLLDPPSGPLLVSIVLLCAITVLTHVRGLASGVLETYTGERLVRAFRAELFDRVQRLSLAYHDRKGATDSVYRIQYDAPSIQWVAVQGIIPFVSSALTVAGMTYVIARIDAQLVLVAMLAVPILFVTTQVFRRRIRREWGMVKEIESSTMSGVQEVLSSLRVVKAFGAGRTRTRAVPAQLGTEPARTASTRGHQWRIRRGDRPDDRRQHRRGSLSRRRTRPQRTTHAWKPAAGDGVPEPVVPASSGRSARRSPICRLRWSVPSASLRCSIRIRKFPRDVIRVRSTRAAGAVVYRDVCFAYPGGSGSAARCLDGDYTGDRVGIMGETGAGKTTLLSLLMRFYDPTSGSITIDGIDLRDLRISDLRNQFAFVLQEPVLFSTSIAENIAYARPSVSDDEIVRAARLANAHEFICRLPYGYRTNVGERGMALSGGERQRIALARAFLKDAPILILDEPTSSIDVRTEAAIVEAIEALMKGRTTFMISHRRETLRNCNVHLYLENGRLVTPGSEGSAAPAVHANPGQHELTEDMTTKAAKP